jgi:hypothetical protein
MHALPEALAPMAAYAQFIVYTVVPHPTKPGKTNKFPCDFRTGRVVSAHDPAVWTDVNTAIAWCAHWNAQGGLYPFGVGFVFTANDPFWFLDIDGAYANGQWSQVATALCNLFPNAAVEVSNSGAGLHIFGTASTVPQHGTRNKAYGLEFYTSGRFVALTGTNARGNAGLDCTVQVAQLVDQLFKPDTAAQAPGAATEWTTGPRADWRGPEDDDQLVTRALRSVSKDGAFSGKATFADLWSRNVDALARTYPADTGSPDAYGGSEADSALASHLAFWTGGDCERILRLMRRSQLAREKWDREDYLPRTIMAACARLTEPLQDKLPEPVRLTHQAPPSGERRGTPRPEPVTGATFLTIEQQIEMFAGCVYVVDQHQALVPGGVMLKPEQFRVTFGGFSFPMDNANERTSRDAWEAFTQNQAFRVPRADSTCFKPDRTPGEIIDDGGRVLVNTWWPVDVPRTVGDAGPFLQHLRKLLPNERDQQILLSYMAACVQHVGVKFQWAPLIQGVEGNGKTLLTRCVAHAVGRRYVHWPKASKLSKEFNGWMVGKVFYAVEDIYTGGSGPNKRDVIEELKPMITGGDGLEIENKGRDQYSADVCGNFMFNTNHKDALPKTKRDRRYAVFYTAQQEPEDLKRDGMAGRYMNDIYAWLRHGGYAIVAELLATWPIPEEFNPAGALCQRAPETSSTEEAITASMGVIEQEILEAVAQGQQGFAGDWISSVFLTRLLEQKRRHLSNRKFKETLGALGYVQHPGLPEGRVNNTVQPDGTKPRLYVRQGSPAYYLQGATVIAGAYTSAQVAALVGIPQAA